MKIVFCCMDISIALRKEKPASPTESTTYEQRKDYEKWDRCNRMCLMIIKRDISGVFRGSILEVSVIEETNGKRLARKVEEIQNVITMIWAQLLKSGLISVNLVDEDNIEELKVFIQQMRDQAKGKEIASHVQIPTPNTNSQETNLSPKVVVTHEEAEEFLRIIKKSDYKVVDQLNQTPSKISMLSLLLSSEAHRNSLMRILIASHITKDITVKQFDDVIACVTTGNFLGLNDDELPPEGKIHNKALHISLKCVDTLLSRVLVDIGSSLNVIPKTTLVKLPLE
ncbi:hypothetical protein KIW84_014147 [Lathyrus oleraceus]|uniref:Uncharacterized protein n=1 Tax=Pisum sativum TaxID=3888 RepID=A0A9D5BMB2_PEA|nr:hypothetical protein KIW84_014147 [Pisum sativum]